MLATVLPDHRRRSDVEVLALLRSGDALAFAEAYRRTADAAHGCARRLFASPTEVEALLRVVYTELWATPPNDEALERWVRGRCFTLGTAHLEETGRVPAAPSLAAYLSGGRPPVTGGADVVEAALASLPPPDLQALLLAHDRGVPTSEQPDPDAPGALARALLALAEDDPAGARGVDVAPLADHALGLLRPLDATRVAETIARDAGAAALLRTYRRGRRRLEGLPPTADMGQRILVAVLSGARSDAPTLRRPFEDASAGVTAPPPDTGSDVAGWEPDPAPVPEQQEAPAEARRSEADPEPGEAWMEPAWPSAETPDRDREPPWTGEEPSPFFGDVVNSEPDRGPDAVVPPLGVDRESDDGHDGGDHASASEAPRPTQSWVLRWVAVAILAALGVVVGIQLGEMIMS